LKYSPNAFKKVGTIFCLVFMKAMLSETFLVSKMVATLDAYEEEIGSKGASLSKYEYRSSKRPSC